MIDHNFPVSQVFAYFSALAYKVNLFLSTISSNLVLPWILILSWILVRFWPNNPCGLNLPLIILDWAGVRPALSLTMLLHTWILPKFFCLLRPGIRLLEWASSVLDLKWICLGKTTNGLTCNGACSLDHSFNAWWIGIMLHLYCK